MHFLLIERNKFFVKDLFKLSHKAYSLWFLLSLFAVNFFPHLFSKEETLCKNMGVMLFFSPF